MFNIASSAAQANNFISPENQYNLFLTYAAIRFYAFTSIHPDSFYMRMLMRLRPVIWDFRSLYGPYGGLTSFMKPGTK